MGLKNMVCRDCGSTQVLLDAWAEWDIASQQWVLQNTFDNAYCEGKCDGETKVIEVDLEEKYPITDWQYEVQNHDTKASYVDWLKQKAFFDGED